MTRKDYELIARAVAAIYVETKDEAARVAIQRVAARNAGGLKADNHAFDPKRFADACGF